MYHPKHFNKFVQNISLDETRAGRIGSALRNLERFLAGDRLADLMTGGIYFQGSYAYDTVTRPLAETTEYDVDVILPLNVLVRPEGRRHPDAITGYVKSRLDTWEDYAYKVTRRRVCVRISYSGLFHIDLVPAHQPAGPGTPLQIPNRETGEWEPSALQEYTAWVRQANGGRAQFRLTRIVKMLKRWRDTTFGEGRGPSSIILTTLAGYYNPARYADHMPFASAYAQDANDASFLRDTLQLMHHHLSPLQGPIILPNPVHREENLAERWTRDDFQLFLKRLETLTKRVEKAYFTEDRERSIDRWRDAFPDAFPARP